MELYLALTGVVLGFWGSQDGFPIVLVLFPVAIAVAAAYAMRCSDKKRPTVGKARPPAAAEERPPQHLGG